MMTKDKADDPDTPDQGGNRNVPPPVEGTSGAETSAAGNTKEKPPAGSNRVIRLVNESKPFWREHFGALAATVGVILASLATIFGSLLVADEGAIQPPEARISIHVGGELSIPLDANDRVIVPTNTQLTFSAEGSLQKEVVPANLHYAWEVADHRCYAEEGSNQFDECGNGPDNNIYWQWSSPKAGLYSITLTVTNKRECYFLQSFFGRSCEKSQTSNILLVAKDHLAPIAQVFPVGEIKLGLEQIFNAVGVLTFDSRPAAYSWFLDGVLVSRSEQYTLNRSHIDFQKQSNNGEESGFSILELVIRDSLGQPSEAIRRRIEQISEDQYRLDASDLVRNREVSAETIPPLGKQEIPAETTPPFSGELLLGPGAVRYSTLEARNAVFRVQPVAEGGSGREGSAGANGANGRGEGGHGMPGGDGMPGTSGERGSTANSVNLTAENFSGSLRIIASGNRGGIGGSGGNGGAGGDGARGAPSRTGLLDCKAGPGRGGRGGAGGNGAAGGAGGNGGDAGAVNVSFTEIEFGSTIVILAEGGLGGEPAPGGRGGVGGIGGPEGATSGNCRSAGRTGDAGAPGRDGARGTAGQTGEAGTITLRIGSFEPIISVGRLEYTHTKQR